MSISLNAQQLTISRSNASLKTVMKDIKSQTGYSFICTKSLLDLAQPVTIQVRNATLDQALEAIFSAQPLSYHIHEKNIVIRHKEHAEIKAYPLPPGEQPSLITIRGRLVDEKNRPVVGGTVKVKKGKSAITDESGAFIISCTDNKTMVQFSCVGFQERSLSLRSLAENPVVKLEAGVNTLREFSIESRKAVGTKVDLRHKRHLNLGQVLEGAVPGLTLRRGSRTNTSELKAYDSGGAESLEELYKEMLKHDKYWGNKYPTFEDFKRAVNNGTVEQLHENNGTITVYKAETTTSSTGVIPELRGVNSFAGGTSGMLVVIDGFPRNDFPADLPMNNVESTEVISDPAECLKWGPKAAGGVILIVTKPPQKGKPQINYSSNVYYKHAPDISAEKLRLASSADMLDYYKEAYDKRIADYLPDLGGQAYNMPAFLSPAEVTLYNLYKGKLTQAAFQQKWDSLAQISNWDQMRLLQRDELLQNHSLSFTMGMRNYDFMVSGLWSSDRNHGISDEGQKLSLNMKHNLWLLKNKLRITLMADFNKDKKMSSAPQIINWDPYQLLLDPQGGYIYHYDNNITPDMNEEMMKAGYFAGGYNPLEDTRSNNGTLTRNDINSNLNINWQLAKGLSWSANITYQRSKSYKTDYTAATSSQGRTLINQYGEKILYGNTPGVIFHIPKGDIMKKGQGSTEMLNIRTGLNFKHTFGTAHALSASIDGGLTNGEDVTLPTYTLYGYDPATGRGLPVVIGSTPGFNNYSESSIDPRQLLVPTLATNSYKRNIAMDAKIEYSYLDRFLLGASYSGIFTPNFGESPAYTSTTTKSFNGSWNIGNESFFKVSWISKLELNVSASETGAASLPPVLINASRQSQPLWNNAAIILSGVNKTELSGQTYRELRGGVKLGLSKNRVMLSLDYTKNNSSDSGQWNARAMYDIAREPWFRFPAMSMLSVVATLQNINSYQGLNIATKANSLSDGGGFSMPANNTQGILPPAIINKEIKLIAGVLHNRFTTELRYYNKTVAGLINGKAPTDPATGLSSKLNYSKSANKGVEMSIMAGIIRGEKFDWNVTANAAYNINQVIDAPPVNFTLTSTYLSAQHNGYSSDNLWGFRWAGLDTAGNPRIYNQKNEKVTIPDSLSVVSLGRTLAPWSGGLTQDLRFGDFFATVRILFQFGHIMRRYMPVLTTEPDRNIAIRDRWRKPGDEAFTDVAAIAKPDPVREFLIPNSDNSLMPADHVRLREIQLGYDFPLGERVERAIKSLSLSAQVLNVAIWTWNKYHLDPETVSNTGVIGSPTPRQYVLSINARF
ncbi:SusC/RagA family TonB-linked outer membrane protein [Chitinophaga polysaccharea]|uniref:SusC/RagA family TonB-linked outer membrane protein n=1 Tax=Chitinophaga polysaccharea TaxID=1293035 RepID=UPI00163B7D25|nr:SusC/RagA family TonB-linked outer membrane protein [Chitinophaga polysaccharea]